MKASYRSAKIVVNTMHLRYGEREAAAPHSGSQPPEAMLESNKALADLFRAMADLLAARKANLHRIRAYRRAAETLLALPEDVGAVAQRGALEEMPGIGKDLSAKIQEFLRTGKIQAYEELKTALPARVAAWISLPGLSESAVQYLYFRLGIRTLSDLEALARSHLLRTLPGVTASEDDLLAAIQHHRATAESADDAPAADHASDQEGGDPTGGAAP